MAPLAAHLVVPEDRDDGHAGRHREDPHAQEDLVDDLPVSEISGRTQSRCPANFKRKMRLQKVWKVQDVKLPVGRHE